MTTYREYYSARAAWVRVGASALALVCACPAAVAQSLESICLNALDGRAGQVVIVSVASGEVLADVQRGAPGRYPPGSVAKLATAHAGLTKGVTSSGTTFGCRNAMKIGGRTYSCTVSGGHGVLNMEQAIARSCNVWFYQAARIIGTRQILKSWEAFGVAAGPAEEIASVERLAVGQEGPRLSAGEMAHVLRIIASKGSDPHSPCGVLARSMRLAVLEGTAQGLGGCRVDVAGKTGSPEHVNDPRLRHGWFAGFAPVKKPEIAIAVFCLEGNAYRSAVPVARKIIDAYFADGRR